MSIPSLGIAITQAISGLGGHSPLFDAAIVATVALGGMPRRALGFGVAALLVAFSRVCIGIHCAGDMVGGALTAVRRGVMVSAFHARGARVDRVVTGIP